MNTKLLFSSIFGKSADYGGIKDVHQPAKNDDFDFLSCNSSDFNQ
jgi:hypothetical protein